MFGCKREWGWGGGAFCSDLCSSKGEPGQGYPAGHRAGRPRKAVDGEREGTLLGRDIDPRAPAGGLGAEVGSSPSQGLCQWPGVGLCWGAERGSSPYYVTLNFPS